VFRHPDKGLYALVTPLSYEPLGIALPGNDPLLMNWAQNWLRDQEATGSLERTRDRWFKNASWLAQLP
jgi:polar amino acid transport system substrate-binding protein